MAVCAGITYNAVNNRITVLYDVADGTKGASFTNPYNFEDIYDTDQNGLWNVFHEAGEDIYICNANILFTGAATYFGDGGFVLQLDNNSNRLTPIIDFRYANIRIEPSGNIMSFIINKLAGTPFTRLYLGSTVYTQYYKGLTFRGFSIFESYNTAELINVIFNGSNNRIRQVTIKDISFYYVGGIAISGTPVQADGVRVIDAGLGIDIFASATIKGLYLEDCTTDIRFRAAAVGVVVNLIDSNIDLTSYDTTGSSTGTCQAILKTTFNANIINGNGAALTVYDKDGNILYTETLVGEDMTEQEIEYQNRFVEASAGVIITDVLTTSQPFVLKVIKAGYQDVEISDITVTSGEPTMNRASLVLLPLEITAIDITDATAIGESDGQLVVTATGGDSTYEYSIDNVNWQGSNTFTGLAAGTYTVYVRDGQAPAFTDSFEVEVNEPVLQPIFREMSFSVAPQTISASVVQRVSVKVTCKN